MRRVLGAGADRDSGGDCRSFSFLAPGQRPGCRVHFKRRFRSRPTVCPVVVIHPHQDVPDAGGPASRSPPGRPGRSAPERSSCFASALDRLVVDAIRFRV